MTERERQTDREWGVCVFKKKEKNAGVQNSDRGVCTQAILKSEGADDE